MQIILPDWGEGSAPCAYTTYILKTMYSLLKRETVNGTEELSNPSLSNIPYFFNSSVARNKTHQRHDKLFAALPTQKDSENVLEKVRKSLFQFKILLKSTKLFVKVYFGGLYRRSRGPWPDLLY